MKNKNKENPVAIRSKNFLTKALLSLMNEKDFNDITIDEITTRADLARRTFYGHFNTKEDIVSNYIESIIEDYMDELERIPSLDYLSTVQVYFKLWYEHIDFIQLLHKNNLLMLLRIFENYIPILNERFQIYDCLQLSTSSIKYAPLFYSGAMLNMLDLWCSSGAKETPDEMAIIFEELLRPRHG